jgi:hypothetical protein
VTTKFGAFSAFSELVTNFKIANKKVIIVWHRQKLMKDHANHHRIH